MSSRFYVTDLQKSDVNEKTGYHQFVVTFQDNSKARVFYHKNPDWKLTAVNRLLNAPCPICRKDYYCKCFEHHAETIDQEIKDSGLLAD